MEYILNAQPRAYTNGFSAGACYTIMYLLLKDKSASSIFLFSGLCNRYQWGCCEPSENCDQFTMDFVLFATDHKDRANNDVVSFDVTMTYDNDQTLTASGDVTIQRTGSEQPLLQAQLWHDTLPADVTQINPGCVHNSLFSLARCQEHTWYLSVLLCYAILIYIVPQPVFEISKQCKLSFQYLFHGVLIKSYQYIMQ